MKFNEAELYEKWAGWTFQQGKKKVRKSHSWQNFLKPKRGWSNLQQINCTIQFNVMLGLRSHEEVNEREREWENVNKKDKNGRRKRGKQLLNQLLHVDNVHLSVSKKDTRSERQDRGEMKRQIYSKTKWDSERENKRERFLQQSLQGNVLWLRVNVLRVNTLMFKVFLSLFLSVFTVHWDFSWKPSNNFYTTYWSAMQKHL